MRRNKALVALLISLLSCNIAACNVGATTYEYKETDILEIIQEKDFIDLTNPKVYSDEMLKRGKGSFIEQQKRGKEFQEDYNHFALMTLERLDTGDNLVYSPLSAYIPLSELEYILDKNTKAKQELNQLLHSKEKGEVYWNDILIKEMERGRYIINGSIWLGKHAEPDLEYLKRTIVSDIYRVHSSDKEVDQKQFDWIHKWTKGSFKKEKDRKNVGDTSTDNQYLAVRLLGSTYLKTLWVSDNYSLVREVFHNKDQRKNEIDFIHNGWFEEMLYYENETFKAFQIPMKNDSNLIAIVPKEDQQITAVQLQEMLKKDWERAKVKFWLPKLDIESSLDLAKVLRSLNIKYIFEPSNSYKNLLGKENGFIGSIRQETKVCMDEEGFEGASYTKVDIALDAVVLDEEEPKMRKIEIKVNKPYLFLVEHNGIITFAGIQNNF